MKRFLILAFLIFFSTASVSLSRTSGRTLYGRVFNRQGQPLAKAVVYLKNMKSLVVKTYISDEDGSYRFPALSADVDYEVYAEYLGARSDTTTLSAFNKRKKVTNPPRSAIDSPTTSLIAPVPRGIIVRFREKLFPLLEISLSSYFSRPNLLRIS